MLETLSILHKSIANIVPIHGVAGNGDGSYRVDYIDDPTQEQLDQVNSIIESWPLEKAKLEKLEEVDEEWETISFLYCKPKFHCVYRRVSEMDPIDILLSLLIVRVQETFYS